MKTYKEVYDIFHTNKDVYVPIFYVTGTMEWFKIDKTAYLNQLDDCCGHWDKPFPCRVEVESDGEVFIHPKIENN
jgi:hypothetical protein